MAALSLKRNIVYAAAGNGLFNVCRFGIVVLITRFATAEALGDFDAAMAWTAPIVTFLMFQLRGAYVADAARRRSFGTYYVLRVASMGVATAAVLALAAWFAWRGGAWGFALTLACVGVGKAVWAIGELHWAVFQQRERLDLMAWSQALRGVVMLAPFALLLPAAHGVLQTRPADASLVVGVAAALYAFGWAIVTACFDRPRAKGLGELDHRWTPRQLGALAVETAPLALVVLIITLCDSLPRLVIHAQGGGGEEQLGYFSAMANVMLPLNLLIIAVGHAASNRVATLARDSRRRLTALVLKLTGVTTALGLAALGAATWFGRPLLALAYGPEYAVYEGEFRLIVAGGAILLLASLFGVIVTYMGKFWVQAPIQFGVLASTAIAAWLLIPSDPLGGGAWTQLIRATVQAVLYAGVLIWSLLTARDPAPGA